jgi:hypothetical protein
MRAIYRVAVVALAEPLTASVTTQVSPLTSHIYSSDFPLAAGSHWLTTYRVTGSADNLERITVDGSDNNKDWLHVTVNRPGASSVLSWERVPYAQVS